ncbi:hypothetical protein [Nocardioides sp. T2.26MG-1]|uniref:hypothetical protein n=1 Tax=Nocardioides sp. T2.26MG-1 TaxID=3041166 RepID=UPI0024779E38|nr:hypothetical protein [Nocardioides sp. T2.26MG-1]CAI9418096.1 hypothetical protein HIDPHFAB_03185 [Nocardioides sp. T2.26MG-1]
MTTEQQTRRAAPALMVFPFPMPGDHVRLAYRELHIAINGTEEEKKALGNHALLPRPWEPASCLDPDLRHDLWEWLEDVVIWLNREYTWDVSGLIPSCWPLHPHLVHEIAVLADQRRRAGLAMTSDALEEWHRYCLPAFTDRMRNRLRAHCDDEHKTWPAKPRHNEHLAEASRQRRENAFAHDVDALPVNRRAHAQPSAPAGPPRLGLVDLDTGEIQDDELDGPQPRTRTEKGPRE